jgi:hypothetical protein
MVDHRRPRAALYSLGASRTAFTLCLAMALGSVVSACRVTETRCRNVWR